MLPTSGAQRKLLVTFIYRRKILGLKSQSSSKCLTHPTRDELLIYSTWLRLAPFLPRWGPRVVSILPNQTVTYQWNNQDKTNNIVRLKQTFQSNRSDPFAFRPKFWLLLSKEGFFWKLNGTASYGQTGLTRQSQAPLLEVNHFDRKISTLNESFHLLISQPKFPAHFCF